MKDWLTFPSIQPLLIMSAINWRNHFRFWKKREPSPQNSWTAKDNLPFFTKQEQFIASAINTLKPRTISINQLRYQRAQGVNLRFIQKIIMKQCSLNKIQKPWPNPSQKLNRTNIRRKMEIKMPRKTKWVLFDPIMFKCRRQKILICEKLIIVFFYFNIFL